MNISKIKNCTKRFIGVFFTLLLLLCQIGFITNTFAETPEPPSPSPGGSGSGGCFDFFDNDIRGLLGEEEWIGKVDYNYVGDIKYNIDVKSVTVSDDGVVVSTFEHEDDSWRIYFNKKGKTKVTVDYHYSSGIGDISGDGSETINFYVNEYEAKLALDSLNDTILPGGTANFITQVKQAIYNSEDKDYEYKIIDEGHRVELQELENGTYNINDELTGEKIMETPTSSDGIWSATAKVISEDGGKYKNGRALYKALVFVGTEMVAETNMIGIQVENEFFEIHNKGDLELNDTNEPRELLLGHTMNAACSGDAAEFEIWKRRYGHDDELLNVDSAEISEFGFSDFEGGMFDYIDDKDGNTIGLKVVNDYDEDLPWEGTIELSVKIDDVYYKNKVPVKVNGYKMKYEGENIKYFNDGSSGSIVFLSSDAINSTSNEIKIKACPSSDSIDISDYVTNYELGYYDEDYDYIVITSDAGVIVDNEYYFLSSDALRHLYDKYKNSNEDACNLILTTKALELSGDATGDGIYALDEFNIEICKNTRFDYELYNSSLSCMPGNELVIELSGRAFFENETVYQDYANYTISGEPRLSYSNNGDNLISIRNNDSCYYICISNDASVIDKTATVSFDYIIENSNIVRSHNFKIHVVGELLQVDYSTDTNSETLIFGSKLSITPDANYLKYNCDTGNVETKSYQKGELNDVDYSLDLIGTDNNIDNSYTEKTEQGNKMIITAKSPDSYTGGELPSNGYDIYNLSVTKGELSASSTVDILVCDEFYTIEQKNNKVRKINVKGDNNSIKLSDFELVRHYLKDEKSNSTWEGKMPATVNSEDGITEDSLKMIFYYYDEDIFNINASEDTLTVKDGWNAFPIDTNIFITNMDERFYSMFEFEIVSEDVSNRPVGPQGPDDNNEEDKNTENGETTVNVEVSKSMIKEQNGTISTTVDSKEVIDSIGSKTKEVTINVTTDNKDIIAAHVTIPSEIIKGVANAEAKLELKTAVGNIKFDKESINTITQNTNFSSITVNSKKLKSSSIDTNYDVSILLNGTKKISSFGKGKISITFDLPDKVDGNKGAKVLYKDGIYYYDMFGNVDTASKTISFETNHLSTYVVADLKNANKRLTESVKNSKTKALKLSSKKGKINLSWKKGEGNEPTSYEIYRSMKKKSGFKKIAQVKDGNMSYIDKKSLRKGKKYYYKVKGMVKINGKKVYTKFTPIKSSTVK